MCPRGCWMLQRRGRRFTWSNKKPDENEETEEAQKTEARSFTRAFRTRHFYTLKGKRKWGERTTIFCILEILRLRVCLRLFVTLVHYNQFILVIERMKHRPFSILLNFSRVRHLTRSHSRLYTGKVARLVCGWVAERCGEARLETEAHVLLRPARTPRTWC